MAHRLSPFSYALMAALLLCALRPALAVEVTTECPRVSPSDNRTPLAFVRILHDGDGEWGYPDADIERRNGNRLYQMNDFEASDFRKARMECIYAVNRRPPLHSIILPMPGLLLRCEDEGIDPPPDPNRLEGRTWCTSRVE
jgi:hypothetical protein